MEMLSFRKTEVLKIQNNVRKGLPRPSEMHNKMYGKKSKKMLYCQASSSAEALSRQEHNNLGGGNDFAEQRRLLN